MCQVDKGVRWQTLFHLDSNIQLCMDLLVPTMLFRCNSYQHHITYIVQLPLSHLQDYTFQEDMQLEMWQQQDNNDQLDTCALQGQNRLY